MAGYVTSLSESEKRFIDANRHTKTIHALAIELGRAHVTVKRYLLKNRLLAKSKQRHWSAEDRRIVLSYRNHGRGCWVKCARELGVSVQSLRSQVARWGIELEYMRVTDVNAAISMYHSGQTTAEIGAHLGVVDETVRCTLKRAGVKIRKYDQRWRESQKRRQHCEVMTHVRNERQRTENASMAKELGWPSLSVHQAIVLAAIARIGKGNKHQVASECRKLGEERQWKFRFGVCSAISVLVDLHRKGIVMARERGNSLRVYRIRPGVQLLGKDELNAFCSKHEQAYKELRSLTRMTSRLTKEVRRVGKRKAAS